MARGRFISLEGGEGVGKSTQLAALAEALRGRGLDGRRHPRAGRKPGRRGDPQAAAGRRGGRAGTRAPRRLLFAAARSDHVEKTIRPALERGEWVLSRPLPRQLSLAYQGEAGGLGHRGGARPPPLRQPRFPARPHAGADASTKPRARRGRGLATAHLGDRIGSRPPSYHAAVDAGFRAMAEQGAGPGQADRRQRPAGDGHRAPALRAGRPAAVIVGPGQGGRAVPDGLAVAAPAPCLAAGRAARASARRASPARRRRGCWPKRPGRRSTCPGSKRRDDHPIARLLAAGSHPDFRLLERLEKPDRRPGPQHQRRPGPRARRPVRRRRPSLSPWRAIVIDSVDDLEASAANALLKMLEEPPANSLFLLVSHAPGRLAADDPLALPPARLRSRLTMTP